MCTTGESIRWEAIAFSSYGVMQISAGGEYLDAFLVVGEEIIGYKDGDELADRLRYYLAHDDEQRAIALNGSRRVMSDHRFRGRMCRAGELI